MSYNLDIKHKKRIEQITYELNVSPQLVEKSLSLLGKYINERISKEDINNDNILSEEEFNDKMPIFKLPVIGYLKPNYSKYKAIQKRKLNKNINN